MEILNYWDTVLLGATGIVTAASVIARITPNKKDDKAVSKLVRFINFLAINKPMSNRKAT